jgi:DNA-binding response OmpR family regulator
MSKKILYIEDEKTIGKILSSKISSAGYEVKHVESVEQAEKLKKFDADLLLVDHGLPGKKGVDAIPDLKKIFTKAKIIILSNYTDLILTQRAKENGADYFWIKIDIPLDDIPKKISKILKT